MANLKKQLEGIIKRFNNKESDLSNAQLLKLSILAIKLEANIAIALKKRALGIYHERERSELKKTKFTCSVCNEPQYESPGGLVCKNGHGGADSNEDE